jgi:hypothetical protein
VIKSCGALRFVANPVSQQKEVHVHQRSLPIMIQTSYLHRDIATSIELRDYLRIQKVMGKEILRGITKSGKVFETEHGLLSSSATLKFLQRLEDVTSLLEHYEIMLETVKEQLNNLLALVSSTFSKFGA